MRMTVKQSSRLAGHAVVGWALCGAVIWIGHAMVDMETALIAHAIAVPVIFTGITWLYHQRDGDTTPLRTASLFLVVVVVLDIVLVALLIERSFAMFKSILGTWIPWVLIFASTYLTARVLQSPYRADVEQTTGSR